MENKSGMPRLADAVGELWCFETNASESYKENTYCILVLGIIEGFERNSRTGDFGFVLLRDCFKMGYRNSENCFFSIERLLAIYETDMADCISIQRMRVPMGRVNLNNVVFDYHIPRGTQNVEEEGKK